MLNPYVTRIRQVAALLGYGGPQILDMFTNTLPNRLYWVVFLIDDLRQAVETAKRFLTKEKIPLYLNSVTDEDSHQDDLNHSS